eukprot:TRINITY_DN11414_c0_g6_i1.p1 TRINITY_DN11414_c0_g6~~TRINITY_DN11414_c0_g6_i1.p1  ORF type:complete len:111 (-),score=18.12 TRINITY_DN11414_c0_g6_i1:64-396(-)
MARPPFEEEEPGSLCCSVECCVQATAFLATPPLLSLSFCALKWLLGIQGIRLLWGSFAVVGAVYWPLVFMLILLAAMRRAPLRPVYDTAVTGLPVVRSLSQKERLIAGNV